MHLLNVRNLSHNEPCMQVVLTFTDVDLEDGYDYVFVNDGCFFHPDNEQ